MDDKKTKLIDYLQKLELFIFKEFALEKLDNVHVRAMNLNMPLHSLCRIFLCDLISAQICYKKNENEQNPFIIFPDKIIVKRIGEKDCVSSKLSDCIYNNSLRYISLLDINNALINEIVEINEEKYEESLLKLTLIIRIEVILKEAKNFNMNLTYYPNCIIMITPITNTILQVLHTRMNLDYSLKK
jgi:hypothetical protein